MIRWAVHRPAVVWAAAIAILISGAIAFTRLSLATKTEVDYPRLSVRASWGSASPEMVEMYLTAPIEAAVQGARGVRSTTSTSSDGVANVSVTLEPDADVQLTRLTILERMEALRADSAFPDPAIRPAVTNYVPDALREPPLLTFSVTGPYTPGAIQKIVNELVVPRIAAVSGVGAASAASNIRLGVAVTYDPLLLRQLEIRPQDLSATLAGSRLVQALGDEVLGASVRHIVLRDEPHALDDVAALPVANRRGRVFRLGELARVTPEEDANGSFSRINGQPAMTMSVSREASADAIRTAAGVRAALAAILPTLPPGLRFTIVRDESVSLAAKLGDLERRAAIAFAAVLLVLVVALRNVRAALLVMGSAAVSIAGTALGLYILHVPANILTLAGVGMGVGILVQDAVVVVDRLAGVPDTPEDRARAARRILPAIVGATLTTIVVLIPFLYLQGDARAAFVPFASAFGLALLWSVLAAAVLVPAIGGGHRLRPRQWRLGFRLYARVLRWMIAWRWATVLLAAAAIAALGWRFYQKVPRYSWGGFGAEHSYINVSLTFPRGSSAEQLDAAIREFEGMAVGRPGVSQVTVVGSTTGARMRVDFDEDAEMTAIPPMLYEELVARAALVGGVRVGVSVTGQSFSSGSFAGSSGRFSLHVLGYSYDGVARIAEDLRHRLEGIPRVNDVRVTTDFGGYSSRGRSFMVTLTPDRSRLARFGLTAADFAAAVQREVSGGAAGRTLTIGGEELTVSLKSEGAHERSLDQLRQALIPTASGAPVHVGDVAAVGEQESMSSIERDDQQYVRTIRYDFRGPEKLARRTHESFLASIAVPPGYRVTDDYLRGIRDESAKGLWIVFGAGVLLVVLAVAMVFDSVWAAWMVLLSLPLALGGVMAAFLLAGTAFTREAAVGVILVVGLAVHQGILLIDAALAHRRSNRARFGRGRLRPHDAFRAALDRAGMITVVTFSTLASLLPLALHTRITDLFGGIALATTGGTVAGTLGAMFVMPALVALGAGRRRRAAQGPAARDVSRSLSAL